jgi:type IV pilus assembly protein PilM
LTKDKKKITAIIDLGARSTTCNILENGTLKLSHSFNISGNELTEVLSRSLAVAYEKAEELKKNLGLVGENEAGQNIREILLPLVDSILAEIKKIFQNYSQRENKEIEEVILAGGTALSPGLKEYFAAELNPAPEQSRYGARKEVTLANPFSQVEFPSVLEETLKQMGPSYAIAVGLAMRGFE